MNRCQLLIAFILFSQILTAQDFIVLKKNSHVIQSWFASQGIQAGLKNGAWVNGVIYKIDKDSLYLHIFKMEMYLKFGVAVLDTTFYGYMPVAASDIKTIPKNKESYAYVRNGAIFKWGGGGYLLLNLINTVSNKEAYFASNNLPDIIISASVYIFGCVLHRLHQPNYVIGKKYQVEYISSKPS